MVPDRRSWLVPHDAWDAGSKIDVRFSPFPYADPKTRYVVLDRTPDGKPSYYDLTDTQWWSVRASAEAGSNFDGLDRVGLRLFLDTNTRFGLKSDWDWYSEKMACGCRETLWIGDVTGTYRFVQNEGVLMTTGLGARFSLDHGHDHGGFNFLYGFDLFPAKPVHVFGRPRRRNPGQRRLSAPARRGRGELVARRAVRRVRLRAHRRGEPPGADGRTAGVVLTAGGAGATPACRGWGRARRP